MFTKPSLPFIVKQRFESFCNLGCREVVALQLLVSYLTFGMILLVGFLLKLLLFGIIF